MSLWQRWCFIITKLQHFGSHCRLIIEDDSTAAMDMDTNGDAESDREDTSAPVKRRRKMVLIDEEEDED